MAKRAPHGRPTISTSIEGATNANFRPRSQPTIGCCGRAAKYGPVCTRPIARAQLPRVPALSGLSAVRSPGSSLRAYEQLLRHCIDPALGEGSALAPNGAAGRRGPRRPVASVCTSSGSVRHRRPRRMARKLRMIGKSGCAARCAAARRPRP